MNTGTTSYLEETRLFKKGVTGLTVSKGLAGLSQPHALPPNHNVSVICNSMIEKVLTGRLFLVGVVARVILKRFDRCLLTSSSNKPSLRDVNNLGQFSLGILGRVSDGE